PRQGRRDLPRPTLDRGAVMHDMPGVVDGVVADGDDPAALSLRAGTLLDALSVLLSENPSRAGQEHDYDDQDDADDQSPQHPRPPSSTLSPVPHCSSRSVNVNVEPAQTVLFTHIRPPWSSTRLPDPPAAMAFAILRLMTSSNVVGCSTADQQASRPSKS